MGTRISQLRGMGPAMEEAFAKAGIMDVERLTDMGLDAAYLALLQSGTRAHFIAYYAVEMALQGRPWNDCTGAEKEALRRRFDKVKAQFKAGPKDLVNDQDNHLPADLAATLDVMGVRARVKP